jgi:hypothetical protein
MNSDNKLSPFDRSESWGSAPRQLKVKVSGRTLYLDKSLEQSQICEIKLAIMNQIYYPGSEMITVCRAVEDGRLLAYTWAKSNDRACWSDDNMVCVRMAHVDLSLSARERIKMVQDMMSHWERLAAYSGNMIICSTTMRNDQAGFLRLHERAGYSVRGSYAYKRLPSRDSLQS